MELVVQTQVDILQVAAEEAMKLEQLEPHPMVVEALQVPQLAQQVMLPLIRVVEAVVLVKVLLLQEQADQE
jgi:hypothetical protein